MRASVSGLFHVPRSGLILSIACGIVLAYLLLLIKFLLNGIWIYDAAGHPLVVDFLPVHVAGREALKGHIAALYDPGQLHNLEAAFIGHPFAGFLGWHYPPLFLLIAMALAFLPYGLAFALWVGATALGFAATVGAIARRPSAGAMALALPPAFACAMVGQNGFFTAILLGAALLWLPRRPILAGALLALLAFKPQLGILIPFALIGGGYYRALLSAAAFTALWVGVGYWLSPESFTAFVHYLPQTSHAVLDMGSSGWGKLQSGFALVHLLGGRSAAAWTVQFSEVALLAMLCVWLWRQRNIAYELKASCLAICCLLATPYVYFYDLPLLAIPLAFVYRAGDFKRTEQVAIAVIMAVLAGFFFVSVPLGLFAALVILAITLRRIGGGQFAALRMLGARPIQLAE